MVDDQGIAGSETVCMAQGDVGQLAPLALVLEAMDIDYHIDAQRGELLVAKARSAGAAQQLHLYLTENVDWPAVRPAVPSDGPVAPTLLMLSALVLLFGTTGPWSLHGEWFGRGMVDA